MTDPVGTTWWWHLSEVEQQMWRQNHERASEIGRELASIKREQATIRTVAKNRCACHAEHNHTMRGSI